MAVEHEATSNINYIGGDTPNDGKVLGRDASDKVGFWGATPVVQQVLTVVGTTTATTALNETRLSRIEAVLETLGLVRTTS